MSRLLNNSNQTRESLAARNLYNPLDPYRISDTDLTKTVNALAKIVSPFSTYDFSNSAIGKAIDPNSPLATSSVYYLGVQFGRTVASNSIREYFPTTTISNVFKKDERVFNLKKDYEITNVDGKGFGNFVENISGSNFLASPFDQHSTNSDYIKNTGKGQLEILYQNLNRNIYKKSDNEFLKTTVNEDFHIFSGAELYQNKPNTLITYNDYFTPFNQYKLNSNLLNIAESNYKVSKIAYLKDENTNTIRPYEYGSTQQFIDDLGKTRINKTNNDGAGEYIIENNNHGLDEDNKHQLIWGRDGISDEYKNEVEGFDDWKSDGFSTLSTNPRFNDSDKISNFNIKNGLLGYTKELLNAQGKYGMFDQTRKKYLDKDEELHFRGSPIQNHPDGLKNSGTFDTRRQHNTLDQYDRFAKAIRYNGNKMYGGNENSVIYDTITPKFHPVIDGDSINNENMMFSIENLASEVIRDDTKKVAYLNDIFNTELPLCEAGPAGGRVMWFPPYDIKLHEQSLARHESTVFLGRSEPIYTYTNSERIATLTFKLIIDYPPQAIGRNHKNAAEFFAFGDEGFVSNEPITIGDKEKRLTEVNKELEDYNVVTELNEPNINPAPDVTYYFPNDEPKTSEDSTSIQNWINHGYEDGNEDINEVDGKDFALNGFFEDEIYLAIDEMLHEDNFDFIKIEIVGSATVLYNGEGLLGNPSKAVYNKALGFRRAEAAREYIKTTFSQIYPERKLTNNKFIIASDGLERATDDTSTAESIPSINAKTYRNAVIRFKRNTDVNTSVTELTSTQIQEKKLLETERDELLRDLEKAKANALKSQTCLFKPYTISDGIIKGFESFETNKFQPVFHSQTPEDFHRRLTFLQQCTRQGRAIIKKNENGTNSAKNAVFGKQPVQILRLGDFFHTKIIIDNISFDYQDAPWDLNPEGFGMQFMIAEINIQMKIIGGQSLKAPIDMLQNAVSFNYYANSTFSNKGIYKTATEMESIQTKYNDGLEKSDVDKKTQLEKIEANPNRLP